MATQIIENKEIEKFLGYSPRKHSDLKEFVSLLEKAAREDFRVGQFYIRICRDFVLISIYGGEISARQFITDVLYP